MAFGAFTLMGFQSPVAQAGDIYLLDKPHTQIIFSINRGGLTRLTGWFEKIKGMIDFDESNVANSRVDVTIHTASLKSGFGCRDKHIISPDFFNVKEFPSATFKSTKIEKTGANAAKNYRRSHAAGRYQTGDIDDPVQQKSGPSGKQENVCRLLGGRRVQTVGLWDEILD